MNKKTKFLLTAGIVAVWIFLIVNIFHVRIRWDCPDYKYLGVNREMGQMFEVNGISYRYLPISSWMPLPSNGDKYLGSADNPFSIRDNYNVYPAYDKFDIYNFNGDVKKIFVELRSAEQEPFIDDGLITALVYYYRTDMTLPTFDRIGIDEVGYETYEQTYSQHQIKPVLRSTGTVNKLFDVIDTATDSQGFNREYSYYFSTLWCMNSNFPGIGIELPVYAYNQNYWVLVNYSASIYNRWIPVEDWMPEKSKKREQPGYAKIPQDLLEAIAGEKLPTASEYIANKQKTASQ